MRYTLAIVLLLIVAPSCNRQPSYCHRCNTVVEGVNNYAKIPFIASQKDTVICIDSFQQAYIKANTGNTIVAGTSYTTTTTCQ